MKEPLKDRVRLEHIVEAINNVISFTKGKTLEDFKVGGLLYYAVVKNVEIIGEAAFHLTKAFCQAHPETDWKGIMSLRHILVHVKRKFHEQRMDFR